MRRRLYKYHPVIGYLKMPQRQFRIHFADGTFRYRTNAAGFRGNGEFEHAKPEDMKRVLVFGDSFTEGGCVDDGLRYTDILQRSLAAQVYNFGISGTGTDQQYLIYREIGAKYEHDLVVVGVWVENIRRNIASSRIHSDQNGRHLLTAKPYFTIEDDALCLHNQPVPRPVPVEDLDVGDVEGVDSGTLARRGVKGLAAGAITKMGPGVKHAAQRISRWQPYPEYDDPDGEAWTITRRILEHWAAESVVPLLVVPIPVYQYVDRTASAAAMQARFASLHAPPDLIVHDPLPDLWRFPKHYRSGFRFPNDHHFTPAGHTALAMSLQPVVRDLLGSQHHAAGRQAALGKGA